MKRKFVLLNIIISTFFFLSCGESINTDNNSMPLNNQMLEQYMENVDNLLEKLNIKSEDKLIKYIGNNINSDDQFYSMLNELCVKPMSEMGYSFQDTYDNIRIVFLNKKYHRTEERKVAIEIHKRVFDLVKIARGLSIFKRKTISKDLNDILYESNLISQKTYKKFKASSKDSEED